MKIRIKRYALLSMIVLFFIFASSPLIIVLAVNTTYVKDKISNYVYQNAGIRIESSTFSLKVLPQPGIKLNHLSITPDENTRITVDSLSLNLDIPSLVRRQISLGKIVVDHPEIVTTARSGDAPQVSKPIDVAGYLLKLKQGFDFLPEEQSTIKLVVKNAVSEFFGKLDATIVVFKTDNDIELNTTIHDLNLPLLSLAPPEVKKSVDLQAIVAKKVKIDATLDDLKQLTGKCRLDGTKLTSKDNTLLLDSDTTQLSFVVSEQSQYVVLEPSRLRYPSATVGVEFSNYPLKRHAGLKFIGSDIQVGQARQMALKLFKDLFVPQTLFEILLDGEVSNIAVSFESQQIDTLLDEHKLVLSGQVSQGKVHIPETALIVSGISGKADIKDGVLDIAASAGTIETSQVAQGRLSVDLLNHEDVLFDGKFNIDLDLSMLPQTLITLLPDTLVAHELAQVKNVRGKTDATLHLSYKDNSKGLQVRVQTADFSATGQYERIPGDIILDNINVEYQPDLLILSRCSGKINAIDVRNLNGSIKLKDTAYLDIQKGTAAIELEKLIPWLKKYPGTQKIISPIASGYGEIVISSIALSGPAQNFEKWKYRAAGKINDIGLSSRKKEQQVHHFSCDFKVSDTEKKLKNANMSVSKLDLLSSAVSKNTLDSIQTPFSIKDARLEINPASSSIKGALDFSTGPSVTISLAGKTLSSLKLKTASMMDQDLSKASIIVNADKNKSMFDFNGSLNTASLNKLLKPESFLSDKLNSITENQAVLIFSDKTNTLNIIIKSLNLNSFLSENKKEERSLLDNRMLTKDLINFKAQKLTVKKFTFTDVRAKMSFNEAHTYIRLQNANLCDLTAKGYLNIKNGKVYANFPIEAKNKDNIQTLLGCLLKKEDLISGQYSVTCNLDANGVGTEKISEKMNGTLSIDARDGRVQKLSLLSRIVSVLNVSKVFEGQIPNVTQTGFAYKSLTVKAKIENSVIHLTHAVIDCHDMAMIFSGTIDPINDNIDLTCLVAPFKTVDLIIEKIPIINTLLGGTLLSVPVKASGKLSDPKVIPLHPSAVGDGLVNMMSTILKTPIKLWEKMAGEKDDTAPSP